MSKPELALFASENDGDGRAYKHPFRLDDNGKPLRVPSVTTVLSLEDKPGLVQWSADQTLFFCVENWFLLGSRSSEDAYSAARFQWRKVRDERAEVGTGVHETIAAEHQGLWEVPDLDEEQEQIMAQWRLFNEVWLVEPILSEFTVWSLEHNYAGTADGLWQITNRATGESFKTLVDLKTSRNIWDGHRMQLAALRNADMLMVKTDPTAVKSSSGVWPEGSWVEKNLSDVFDGLDKVQILQLRAPEYDKFGAVTKEAFWLLEDVEDVDLWGEQFVCYRNVWDVRDRLKSRAKERNFEGSGF
jgi:hypothetical protein